MTELPGAPRGDLLAESQELDLAEFCQACGIRTELARELIDHGVVDLPGATETSGYRWYHVVRVRRAVRLQRDLGVNTAGAALALDLLDELDQLRQRLRLLDP